MTILHSKVGVLKRFFRTDKYQKLRDDFERSMNTGDVTKGIEIYESLKSMLHPTSAERDILDMDMAQLKEVAK